MNLDRLRWASVLCLLAMIVIGVGGELWWAPLRPGGSWLVLKVLPLLLCLRGLMYGRRYVFQALSLLVWIYAAEGSLRAFSDGGMSAALGLAEVVLAIALFGFCAAYSRLSAPSRLAREAQKV